MLIINTFRVVLQQFFVTAKSTRIDTKIEQNRVLDFSRTEHHCCVWQAGPLAQLEHSRGHGASTLSRRDAIETGLNSRSETAIKEV